MHPRAIAQRNANATNRTRVAADRIAASLGIEPLQIRITPRGGPEAAQLQLREAIAEYLERIAGALPERVAIRDDIDLKPSRESPRGKGAAVTATEEEPDGNERHDEAEPQMAGAK